MHWMLEWIQITLCLLDIWWGKWHNQVIGAHWPGHWPSIMCWSRGHWCPVRDDETQGNTTTAIVHQVTAAARHRQQGVSPPRAECKPWTLANNTKLLIMSLMMEILQYSIYEKPYKVKMMRLIVELEYSRKTRNTIPGIGSGWLYWLSARQCLVS